MDDTKKLIEKYKRELMELSRTAPKQDLPPISPMRTEISEPEEIVETAQTLEEAQAVEAANMTNTEEPKAPKIIGYVSEESGEFPTVFDRFITEAVENNVIETISAEHSDMSDDMSDEEPSMRQSLFENNSESSTGSYNSDNTPNTNTYANTSDIPVSEMDRGTGESISNFPVPEYSTVSEFEASNTGGGTLEFRVSAAREAFPIEGAAVVVTARINGRDHQMFADTTDNSGETEPQTLPAPSKSLSQDVNNLVQPFALYDATVEKDGFARVVLKDIPIFDGVQSIQRVAMVPEGEDSELSEEITEVPNAK